MGNGELLYRRKAEARRGYASAVVCGLALVVAWVVALPRVPFGWPVIALNGGGYALSVIIMAGGYDQLKRALRPFHSFLVMAATWLIIAVGVREALLRLLG
ncbi:MAG: hypothetical protein M0R22_07120 [Dehalococcoidia bacterium]|jgi:hypothetical protein|nr:hypothetical protein [Dehalococcoidia bacterium]